MKVRDLFLVVIFCFFMVTSAAASPFLICGIPNESDKNIISYYELTGLSGTTAMRIPPENVAFGFKHDLSKLPIQTQTVVGKACSEWGCSDASKPFMFKNDVPTKPVNLREVKIGNTNWLVSDLPAATDCLLRYTITEKKKTTNSVPDANGTYGLKYNISKLSTGTHVLTIRAVNPQGLSQSVKYTVEKKIPAQITIGISP